MEPQSQTCRLTQTRPARAGLVKSVESLHYLMTASISSQQPSVLEAGVKDPPRKSGGL